MSNDNNSIENYNLEAMVFKNVNILAAAFLGDGVYELAVREYIMNKSIIHSDALHKEAVKYVNATSQGYVAKIWLTDDEKSMLEPEEVDLLRRARNKKSTSKSRSATPKDYKLATAMESLIGALWQIGEKERAWKLCEDAIALIDDKFAKAKLSIQE